MGDINGRSAYTTIIASRAGEPLLAETLASIAEQTLTPERVVVVCDSREQLPPAWTAELTQACNAVEFLLNPDAGQVSAINWGISHTETPYVSFLDADDLWQPDKQRRQIDALDRDPGLDAANCLAANFEIDDAGAVRLLPSTPSIMFTCTTFRREAFERFGSLDPSSTHFTWLYRWWGAAKAKGISLDCVDYVGLFRRLHPSNSWNVQNRKAHRDLFGELRRHVNRDQE